MPSAGGDLMPAGETEQSPSAWTIDSLHEHLTDAIAAVREWASTRLHASEQRIDAAIKAIEDKLAERDDRYQQRFEAQQSAIDKAETTIVTRLEGMNEFRKALTDQAKEFMPRIASDARYNALTDTVTKLEDRLNIEVRRIDNRLDTTSGGVSGADKYRTTLFALLAAAATIVGLAFALFGRN